MSDVLAVNAVDLLGRDKEKVRGYSFGMRQRLGVAAALPRQPRLLVLDEPANGLDPAGIRDMRALVKRHAGSGLTVLLSSHDMAEVEQICDDVTIMRTGQVVYHGPIATLRDRAPAQAHRLTTTDNERAAAFAKARALDIEVADGGLPQRLTACGCRSWPRSAVPGWAGRRTRAARTRLARPGGGER
ncbi:AAA family ATPase [Dactylosporangium sp. NPDC000244]|uniref:AAA family ATPase n=1 Tax=Dactylosporangium sp. NPDC000244 TaxID=3154365 RepID=UPI00331F8A70